MEDSSKSKRKTSFLNNNNNNITNENNIKMKIEEEIKNVSKIDEDKDNLNYSPFITENINEMLEVNNNKENNNKQNEVLLIKNNQKDIISRKETKKKTISKLPKSPINKLPLKTIKPNITILTSKKNIEKNSHIKTKKNSDNKIGSKEIINNEIPEEIIRALLENTEMTKIKSESNQNSNNTNSIKITPNNNINRNEYIQDSKGEGVRFQYFDRRPPSYKTLKEKVLKRKPKE